jgi:hypothetical protein
MAAVSRFMANRAVAFAWQQGDVLLIDNRVAMHSREPFQADYPVKAQSYKWVMTPLLPLARSLCLLSAARARCILSLSSSLSLSFLYAHELLRTLNMGFLYIIPFVLFF